MAIIDGVTMNWRLSPRIIIIPLTETDITIDDLQDTLLDLEDDEEGMMWPHLRKTSGGETLDESTNVGLTMELQNAKVYFAARSTPLDNGSGRTCDLTNTAGIQLYVDDADFVSDGVYAGCTVFNATTAEMATVTEVVDLHTLNSFPLSGGGDLGWTSGDNYMVYPNVQCSITGGNLVAVDDVGAPIDPVFQSPNVQVVKTSSASATLQELGAIQYSSFGDAVHISVNGVSGTAYNIGTHENPVNNIADALAIAQYRGFDEFRMEGDFTFEATDNIDDYRIVGRDENIITITDGCSTIGTNFRKCILTGTLGGKITARQCELNDLAGFYGIAFHCLLNSEVVCAGTSSDLAQFIDCWLGSSVAGVATIDCGGDGPSVSIKNFSGAISFKNKTGEAKLALNLIAAGVTLESTVTAGNVYIHGVGSLTDNSTGTAVVYSGNLINPALVADAVWDDPDATFMLKVIKNKKAIAKTGLVWELIIYDDDDTTPIMNKALKDMDGNNITDLEAGTLAQEIASSI